MEILKSLVNKIKSKLKLYAILGLIAALGVFGFKACRKIQKTQDTAAVSTILKPNEERKVIIDPIKHKITTVTRNPDGSTKTRETYLPDRPTQIIENKDGTIKIIVRKFGTEVRPYIGVGFGDVTRIQIGTDVFYYKKLDLGLGLGFNPTKLKDIRPNLNLSYNVYSNTSLFIGVDSHRDILGGLKVRF